MSANSDLEDIYETLNTRGWDLLVADFQIQFDDCNQVVACKTPEELHYRRGMIAVFQQLINLRADIKDQMNADL